MFRNYIKLLIVVSISISPVYAGQYDDIKKSNASVAKSHADKQYWINEANTLIREIDIAVAKRHQLDINQMKEILAYISFIDRQISREQQFFSIAKQRCKKQKMDCNTLNSHQNNIGILTKKRRSLFQMKNNLIRK